MQPLLYLAGLAAWPEKTSRGVFPFERSVGTLAADQPGRIDFGAWAIPPSGANRANRYPWLLASHTTQSRPSGARQSAAAPPAFVVPSLTHWPGAGAFTIFAALAAEVPMTAVGTTKRATMNAFHAGAILDRIRDCDRPAGRSTVGPLRTWFMSYLRETVDSQNSAI